MSKKIVLFTPAPQRERHPDGGWPDSPSDPQTATADWPRHEPDSWVLAARPESARPADVPEATARGPAIINLSVIRSWPELVQLICVFPYLATWYWMSQAVMALPGSSRPR